LKSYLKSYLLYKKLNIKKTLKFSLYILFLFFLIHYFTITIENESIKEIKLNSTKKEKEEAEIKFGA